MSFIRDNELLDEITGSILKTGYDADFVSLITEMARKRVGEL
jgi:hypothetical protein